MIRYLHLLLYIIHKTSTFFFSLLGPLYTVFSRTTLVRVEDLLLFVMVVLIRAHSFRIF